MDFFRNNLIKIALCGKANTGKNTVAKLISNEVCKDKESSFTLAFADPIKRMIMTMFPWADSECLYGSSELRSNVIPNILDKEGKPLTYRQLLIDLGTHGRAYDKNHWINVFDHTINFLPEDLSRRMLICTDIRFRNEFDYLKSKGFYITRIYRNSIVTINHSTETNQDQIKDSEFNFVLDNNGSLEDLTKKVQEIVSQLKLN